MMKDKNNIDEILSIEDEHLFHRAGEVQFNKEMELFDSFMADGKEIPGLSDFDRRAHDKINEMYRDGRKHHRHKLIFKTVAASAAVILLTFIFYPPLFGKVNAFLFRMMNLTATDNGEYTEFRLEPADNQHIEELEGCYYPKYMPDGYEIIVKNNMESMGTIIYSNKSDGTSITYEFSTLNSPQQLDTENCNKEEIMINNQLGILYTNKDNSGNMIIFQNEEYKFVVYGEAGVEILRQIAESIKR